MISLREQGSVDTRRGLLALAQAYHRFVQDHPGAWQALLAYNRGRIAANEPDAYLDRLDALFEIIAEVLAAGYPKLAPEVIRRAARALWSSVHGIVTSGYAARSGIRRDDEIWSQVDLLVTTFLIGLDRRQSALTVAQ